MKEQVIKIIERALMTAQDDLYQAEFRFGKMSEAMLRSNYGQSGQTCGQIFQGYKDKVAELQQALGWVKSQPIWPSVFETGVTADKTHPELCAAGLEAWWLVYGGHTRPYNFGTIMAQIAVTLGISGTADSFMEWADMFKKEKE